MNKADQSVSIDVKRPPKLKREETNIWAEGRKIQENVKSDIEKASFFSFLYFTYVWELIKGAFTASKEGKTITMKDLVTFPYKYKADVLSKKLSESLRDQKAEDPNKKSSLTSAILWTVRWPLFNITFIETLFIFVRIFSAWIVKKLIDCFTDPTVQKDDAWKWAGFLSVCLVVAFHLEHHFNHLSTYLPNHIQHALIDLIYGKITRLSTDSLNKISIGKLINLCTNGVNIFEQLGMFAVNVFVGIAALIMGGFLLWQYFGAYSLIGVGYMVFWYPWQQLLIVLSLKERNKTNLATARRIRLTSETLEAIRLLKMYTWEMSFKEKIQAFREVELKMLRSSSITSSTIRGISFSVQVASSFLMFLAYVLGGHQLNAGIVFSGYFVIQYLRIYSSYFLGLALNFLTDANILLNTVEQVLETPEIGDKIIERPYDPENAIEFDNFTAFWSKEDEEKQNEETLLSEASFEDETHHATLRNINLKIKKGSLNALVGTVGSGKTSLLMAFTGEMPKTSGSLRFKGKIALVEQEPTIFAGTFRENITFGKLYDSEFYAKVIKACNLESDLKLFPQGDLSLIGEKGNNLSGGQKARLALARAVYSDADIYLLDDPLSAVDPKVARSLYRRVIDNMLQEKTVLLTTHQVDFAVKCENIILMDHGEVRGCGSYEELRFQNVDVDKIFGQSQKRQRKFTEDSTDLPHFTPTKLQDDDLDDSDNQEGADEKQLKEDQYAVSADGDTYIGLMKEMGGFWFFLLVFFAYLTCEFANMGYGIMLGVWITGALEEWKAITILAIIVVYDMIIYIVKYQLLGLALIRASRNYHDKMLDKVIKATVLFFDTNAVGQILNRFANDVGILDRYIPLAVMDITNIGFVFLGIIVTVGIINPIILGPYLLVAIAVYLLFQLTFPAVKQCKLMEIRRKGPLYGLLSATLSGIIAIRVYNHVEAFKQKFKNLLHHTLQANVNFTLSSRFMAFYIDLVYNIAAIGCIFILTARAQNSTIQEGNFIAFGLVLVVNVTGLLQHALRQFSQMTISMSAIARMQAYLTIPQEPPLEDSNDDLLEKQGWPQKGEVEFNKVYMKYLPDSNHVINNLSFKVQAGHKIGCVGRTGAGKSTIIQLLYRMQEIDHIPDRKNDKSFIKLDNVEIHDVGLRMLRNNISFIPQTAYIFSRTIRLNIDPLGEFTDEEIWSVLEDVRLKAHVERQPLKLNTVVESSTSIFSAGQKQLVCLARAILKKSNILIMDEATANMDYETENLIQKKIEQRFAHATQFTIAHRLQTIANYDKVLVLDRGRKVEFDEPYKLLVKNIGDTQLTNLKGHFSVMVQNTGPISAQKIFEIALESYFERNQQIEEENRENKA